MPKVILPMTYRVSPMYWVLYTICPVILTPLTFLFLPAEFGFWILGTPFLTGIMALLEGFLITLVVTGEGFCYTTLFTNKVMFWSQLEMVDVQWTNDNSIFWNWFFRKSTCILIYGKNSETPIKIPVNFVFGKGDLKEFLKILKFKAPRAIFEPGIVDL